ncbi:DUF7677 family protein [Flavivirga jejuensis]|uniref:DUF7677 domain-containing protein n=1 Tax=Flavivirga jejuensis TaxID=870487 RepID=A0ABT8WQP1_9FLAO|nr:hypothetical protein [Flavivirga jejuensis]MDO5975497.1 hypothetical protein [Flavivirga jejuensis]
MKPNQLDIDDLQDIGKYMFSIANGNHILRYSEMEYRDFLIKSPNTIVDLLIIYYASSNWGCDDARMFENYDEQWLTEKIDARFNSSLDFKLPDFSYANLQPYQQVVIDLTKEIINEEKGFSTLLNTGTPIERIYAVLACNIDIDKKDNKVKNKAHAIARAIEMYKTLILGGYEPSEPFEDWELIIY